MAKVKQTVTRKDIMEFSGQPSDELQQSGQINVVTETRSSVGTDLRRPHTSETALDSGSRSRPPRDNSIIERNMAKLAEFADKKLKEKMERLAEEQKSKEIKEAKAKLVRPFDPHRLDSLSQPKPKADDPTLKSERPKSKKVSAQTRRQLQERAKRVKMRQQEASGKAVKSKMLAITDGSLGSNLISFTEDNSTVLLGSEAKRKSNIIKSRELRQAKGTGIKGRGSVFERLSLGPQKQSLEVKRTSLLNQV